MLRRLMPWRTRLAAALTGAPSSLLVVIALFSAWPAAARDSVAADDAVDAGSGWRLVRTTSNPMHQVVSVVHTADGLHSDPDLAGMMLMCSETGFDVLIVVISPYAPDVTPVIRFDSSQAFEAKPVAAGAALRLPHATALLAQGPWLRRTELTVRITANNHVVQGTIPVVGLDGALKSLASHCSNKPPATDAAD